MNNNYYQNPVVDDRKNTENKDLNYIDIFNMNKGKIASFYMSFSTSCDECKIFNGVLENASCDNVIISDPKTGKWTLLILKYLNYVIFEENINY